MFNNLLPGKTVSRDCLIKLYKRIHKVSIGSYFLLAFLPFSIIIFINAGGVRKGIIAG
jgi:hypothetical protein